jgi:hypothetical protein
MRGSALRVFCAALALALAALTFAPRSGAEGVLAGTIADYMLMEVCVDAHDHVVEGLTPVSPGCEHRRQIRESDPIPYHLSGFDHESGKCPGHTTIHDNLPLTHDGVTRIVSFVRVGYELCGEPKEPEPAYYSVRWVDGDYGFLMGAWGRGKGEGTVGGGITPSCKLGPATSGRYFRDWPIGPRIVEKTGEVGYAIFSKASAIHGLPPLDSPCPASYDSRFLSLWTRGMFKYRSGVTLDTLLSHPYSQTDPTGTTPGRGAQMERTYWTREFGEVRWENWKRDDYADRDHKTAIQLARQAFAQDYCSKPFDMSAHPTPGIKLGPIESDGAYSQTLTDLTTGEQHRWFMAGCLDLTNLVTARTPGGDPYPQTSQLPAKFWDFWIPAPKPMESRG